MVDRKNHMDQPWLMKLQYTLSALREASYLQLATPIQISFEFTPDVPDEPSGHKPIPIYYRLSPDGEVLTKAAITRRVTRRQKRVRDNSANLYKPFELAAKYAHKKPIEEWDSEELARGRPRNKNGSFSGPKPAWVSAAVHEAAVERFAKVIKTEMGVATITAMEELNKILQNDELDYRGKPVISPGTKLDAAKFLIEHMVGKPTQRIESDISVKLQNILGSVIVNPDDDTTEADLLNYQPAHFPGVTMELASKESKNE